jgi:dienelactone hydrolase
MGISKAKGLLVMPGWRDDGERQYEDIKAQLQPSGWVCRRARIPDASWAPRDRATVTRASALQQLVDDYMDLTAVKGVSRRRIALLGFSFGAYMATFLVSSKPAELLVLRSPALYPDQDWMTPKEELDKAQLEAYRSKVRAPSENRSLRCCSEFVGDVLLIDSSEDEVIPPTVIASYERAFERARSLTRYTLVDADHELSQPAWRREYHNVALEWLEARMQR